MTTHSEDDPVMTLQEAYQRLRECREFGVPNSHYCQLMADAIEPHLTTTPPIADGGAAVAWQLRYNSIQGGWSDWREISKSYYESMLSNTAVQMGSTQLRALFTQPTPADGGEAAAWVVMTAHELASEIWKALDMKCMPGVYLKQAHEAAISVLSRHLHPAPTDANSVGDHLRGLENWAIAGGTLSGDDIQRFRALADRIAPTETNHLGNLLAVTHRDGGHYQSDHGTDKAVEDALRIISQLHVTTDANSGGVPEGWKLVPIEPTVEQLWEMECARYGYERGDSTGGSSAMAYFDKCIRPHRKEPDYACRQEYRALIAYAPTPPMLNASASTREGKANV
jgi:hypothetical protein